YYDGGVKKMRPINSFKDYAAIRNSQKNRRNTKAARDGDNEAKKHMVQFCYSCLPNDDGTLKGTKRVSNSVGMDIDFTKDMPKKEFEAAFEIMKDNILDNAEQLRLLMLERSATKGLHLVFERHPDLSQEKNLEWAQKLLGVEFDKGAKDITRVFFTPTADPKDLFFCKDELFINEESVVKKEGEVKKVVGGEVPVSPNTSQPSELKERVGERLYNGLPYSHIVKEFLRQFNNGETPVEGNRNVMTFELAKALRSICDYNIDIMKQVIPRYDNFPEDEYTRTLQSALDEPRRGVSYKLQKVLEALYKNENKMEGNVDFEAENELPPEMPKKLPYPLGLLSSKVPEMYKAAVCEAVFAPLSTYVHGVKFRYWDGVEHEPTFMSVLCAPMSIGKGCVRKPINIILEDLLKRDESNRAREAEWKVKNPSAKQKKDPRPSDICIQVLIDNLTDAVFNQRVYDADKNGQRYLYTSVDELDTLKNITSRGTSSEVSVIIRKAFDNSKHGQERVGADSVTGIAPLRFNFNASTTPRNFQKFFCREMTTGTITRLSLSTIIKPADAKRPVFKEYDSEYIDEVRKITQKLSSLSGEIPCPNCNKFAEQLCDENEKLAALYGSDSYLTLSYRSTVIAWLKGMMLYVMNGEKWTKEIQDYMEWSLRYDLWVKMNIIGKMLDEAQNEEVNATSSRGPKNMLLMLKDEFKIEDLIILRKRMNKSVDLNIIKTQLCMWRTRNLVEFESFNDVIRKIKK
ncbi:MAG: hypothetical protein PUH48_04530, partial [Prevotella sp.]|nr:hypothetical protein [Prevotella sp.]